MPWTGPLRARRGSSLRTQMVDWFGLDPLTTLITSMANGSISVPWNTVRP